MCLKVYAAVCPQLGVHVLLKLKNKLGFDLGECVVGVTHLLDNNRENKNDFEYIEVNKTHINNDK